MVMGMTAKMTVVVLMKLITKAVMMNECFRLKCLFRQINYLVRGEHNMVIKKCITRSFILRK
jgi:hypothetical protein